eukprot:CAMPEP_0196593746 /NCGR_PEP_ID=MMETSP1081-20130531/76423_1 /TAXON_ID=36882 /ORGANISM="Pyramimonas amylifera, Strain CCMP720" /LENGTH=78 /DNA_ID=CAMNT_0041917813 /DNA_START=147 /DNA_END=384 /DNA_ORIENTATION=+
MTEIGLSGSPGLQLLSLGTLDLAWVDLIVDGAVGYVPRRRGAGGGKMGKVGSVERQRVGSQEFGRRKVGPRCDEEWRP